MTLADLEKLPPEQLQQVLDFAQSLQLKTRTWPEGISALEAAGDVVGCATGGPSDLSSNPKHLEGLGK